MKAWNLLLFVIATMVAGMASATDYVVEWPKERQMLLVGHYKGLIRDWHAPETACEYRSAGLQLQANHRYKLVTRCNRGKSVEDVATGPWWVDINGDSCLILEQEDSIGNYVDHLYGFRIYNKGSTLHQDGANCAALDDRDHNMILQRVSQEKP